MSADDRLARAIEAALCQRHGGTSASVRVLGWSSFRSTGPWRALAEVQNGNFPAGPKYCFAPKALFALPRGEGARRVGSE